MREHELELIAALAEGRLEEESEARALISSSEEAMVEYELQKAALGALSGAAPVTMSETERAELRRELWTELRATPAGASTGPAKPWYHRWMPVAAGLFVIVGLVSVLSQGGLDTMVASDQGAAAASTMAASETTAALSEEQDSGDDAGGETVTEAPTNTIAEAGDGDSGVSVSPAALAYYSDEAEEIRTTEEPDYGSFGQVTTTEIDECLADLELEGYEVRKVVSAPHQTGEDDEDVPEETVPYIAAIQSGDELATATVVFVALETCEVIHVDE